jgi:two-component system, chemotaxis family, CheB/CheR fusion protein
LASIQSYRILDNVIEGVVLTFPDSSKRIEAETAVQPARDFAGSIVDTLREPLPLLNGGLQVVCANGALCQYFQVTVADMAGRKIYLLGNRQWDISALGEILESLLPRDQTAEAAVVVHDFPAIGHRKSKRNARRIVGKVGEPSLIGVTTEDLGDVCKTASEA